MSEQPGRPERPREYRIEDLAHRSGATVRTIRAYQDRGLLPKPERRGRANVYGDAHLARLRQIAGLLDRGYTLASIKELLDAWDTGRGLGAVLGLVAEVAGPWTDEEAGRITRPELDTRFGGTPDDAAVEEAVRLGVLVRVPDSPEEFLVPSPQELAVAAELHAAGVPLSAITGHLRELRTRVERIAGRFLDFTTEYVFRPYLGHPPTEEEAAEAAALVRRLRPLAQQTVDAELARAMRAMATRYLRHHLDGETVMGTAPEGDDAGDPAGRPAGGLAGGPAGEPAGSGGAADPAGAAVEAAGGRADSAAGDAVAAAGSSVAAPGAVRLPEGTVRAVADLVGPENVAAFIAAAAEREVRARTMDALVTRPEAG
ncbi:MerR family transcriptional regulator [Streptomyces hiroshimensis]|uniref:HTH merR-type domain-containing protein n=1 Tax=Streptomyces hiroshimensis TaxID=66424 RepID=A0ABQ2YTD4_9ACTN|nr:MerR family transcriptional regulator [Streptomyces hiroshimensis]GGX92641.1 hypothetical protein GCM10010324_43160 [Streptomyces hiroshimensis]